MFAQVKEDKEKHASTSYVDVQRSAFWASFRSVLFQRTPYLLQG